MSKPVGLILRSSIQHIPTNPAARTITRRHEAVLRKAQNDQKLKSLSSQVIEQYHQIITQESHKLQARPHPS